MHIFKDVMLYVNKRPVNIFAKGEPLNRFHQFRVFGEDATAALKALGLDPDGLEAQTQAEKIFVLPGRRDVVVKIVDGDRFAMRRRIGDEGDTELWEQTANTELPLRRSVIAMVASHIPHMRAALSSFRTPEDLAKGLCKRARMFDATTTVRETEIGPVTVRITDQEIGESTVRSVTLRADEIKELNRVIANLPQGTQGRNIGDVLLAA